MEFANPLLISETTPDMLQVTFLESDFLFDIYGQPIEPGSLLKEYIPAQYANEGEAAVFDALQNSVSTVETGYFSSDVTLNAIIAGVL